jgi:uncharacterized protein (UPF0128 family)
MDDNNETLWRDRKRVMGLPLSFTKYEVGSGRFITRVGLLRSETNEIMLYRIVDLKLVRTLGQKIFGVGTITLYSADRTDRELEVKNIRHPEKVRMFLSKQIEVERKARGIIGREFIDSGDMHDHDGDGIPD